MIYAEGFKDRMIERMASPEGISASALSHEVGVSQQTLSRWLKERKLDGMRKKAPKRQQQRWTATEKLRVVREAANVEDDQLGELLRREGLHESQLREWIDAANAAALASLSSSRKDRTKSTPEQKKIHQLEKELARKDKALAEVGALLALKKKVQQIWGEEDDDTPTRSAT